jgi:seryl-tRNA synthetase
MPIDINLFREEKGGNPEIVRESQRRRGASVELVDLVIELDKKWRTGTTRLFCTFPARCLF